MLFSRIETTRRRESRVRKVKSAETDRVKIKAARDRVNEMSKRRKSVQDSLKDLEKKQQEKSAKAKPSMKVRLIQAGLQDLDRRSFTSPAWSSASSPACWRLDCRAATLPVVAGIVLIGSAGLPRWFVNFMIKRRLQDISQRISQCARRHGALDQVRPAAQRRDPADRQRGQEPVKTEFRRIIEAQQIGLNVPEACARMINTMPLPEVNFFAIVIAIQAQAGGNLSEALGNLSQVLRERKKMKAKVQALSMEAKASACIIGALPFIVAFLVYMTSPDYMMILFTDPRGHLIMGCSAVWMSIGIWVMRNMINFDI